MSKLNSDFDIAGLLAWLWAPIAGAFMWMFRRMTGTIDRNEDRITEIEKDDAVRDERMTTLMADVGEIKDVTTSWKTKEQPDLKIALASIDSKLDALNERKRD